MAIGNKKSKMGSMLGVDLNSIQQSQAEPMPVVESKQPEEKPIKKEQSPLTATPKAKAAVEAPSPLGGRPKFELIAGMEEKKVNFHCPEVLYTAINLEAIKQKKTVKQFICEVLLEEMASKYGFKIK